MSRIAAKDAQLVNRILFVKNLSFKVTTEELFDLFGRFGAIRQIRLGDSQMTRGTAFVVYESAADAKQALDKLQGFNFQERYLVCMLHTIDKTLLATGAASLEVRQQALQATKEKYGID